MTKDQYRCNTVSLHVPLDAVEVVIENLGLKHPIIFDVYRLNEYYHSNKLSPFSVSVLKDMYRYFEIPYKSRDLNWRHFRQGFRTCKAMRGQRKIISWGTFIDLKILSVSYFYLRHVLPDNWVTLFGGMVEYTEYCKIRNIWNTLKHGIYRIFCIWFELDWRKSRGNIKNSIFVLP